MVCGNGAWRAMLAAGAVGAVLLSACAPKQYDPVLENASSGWREKIGAFITSAEEKAGTPGGTYESNKQFYEDMQTAIGGQLARLQAASSSKHLAEILQLLSKDIENLRTLHESGGEAGLSQALGEPARQAIETELNALDKLQSEYKAGSHTASEAN